MQQGLLPVNFLFLSMVHMVTKVIFYVKYRRFLSLILLALFNSTAKPCLSNIQSLTEQLVIAEVYDKIYIDYVSLTISVFWGK